MHIHIIKRRLFKERPRYYLELRDNNNRLLFESVSFLSHNEAFTIASDLQDADFAGPWGATKKSRIIEKYRLPS